MPKHVGLNSPMPLRQRVTGSNGNAADYFIDRHLREGRGGRLAFADPWRSVTYSGLAEASARFAAPMSGKRAAARRVYGDHQ